MEVCKICNKECKNMKSLSTHIVLLHKISTKEYYDTFLVKKNEGNCVVCNGQTSYRNMGIGYLDTCSMECRNSNKNIKRDYWKGKKQSKETIDKRIKNTNQQLKQENWEKSNLVKYGVINPSKLESVKNKISQSNKGIKKNRTVEWQKNIINSKKKNGTLKHSNETKVKISNKLTEYYKDNLDREKYIATSNNVKHLSGWYNGLYFRSSLELSFLVRNNHKTFVSCEVKKYAVNYYIDDKVKVYYPDYTDGEFIYEIKPTKLLKLKINLIKIGEAIKKYGENYKIITEEECNYISKSLIKSLIENGNVILVKKSEILFEKYKH